MEVNSVHTQIEEEIGLKLHFRLIVDTVSSKHHLDVVWLHPE